MSASGGMQMEPLFFYRDAQSVLPTIIGQLEDDRLKKKGRYTYEYIDSPIGVLHT